LRLTNAAFWEKTLDKDRVDHLPGEGTSIMEIDAPTSLATTGVTEPEVVAGIASGEGQSPGYWFEASAPIQVTRNVFLVVAAGLIGFVIGVTKRQPRRH
jgi:hypothetical protein